VQVMAADGGRCQVRRQLLGLGSVRRRHVNASRVKHDRIVYGEDERGSMEVNNSSRTPTTSE
jgi:hypothetical protein